MISRIVNLERMKLRFPDVQPGGGRSLRAAHVTIRYDTDQLAIFHHRQSANGSVDHQLPGFENVAPGVTVTSSWSSSL